MAPLLALGSDGGVCERIGERSETGATRAGGRSIDHHQLAIDHQHGRHIAGGFAAQAQCGSVLAFTPHTASAGDGAAARGERGPTSGP